MQKINVTSLVTAGMNLNLFYLHSLKTRVTLFTLAIFVIGIWTLALYVHRMQHEEIERMLGDQQLSTASFVAAEINDELSDRLTVLKMIAGSIKPSMLGNAQQAQTALEQLPAFQRLFNGGTFIMRVDGTAIASLPLWAGRIGVNFMDSDFIAPALKEGQSVIGQPVIGRQLKAPVFYMTVPIRDARGKVIGALAGVTNLSQPNFLDKITQNHYGKTGGYLLVAPQNRLVVTSTDKSRVMQPLPATGINPMIDRHIQGYEGTDTYINSQDVEVLASAKGVPVAGWYVLASLPTAEALAPIHDIRQRLLIATLFLTLLAGGLTWWMLKRQLSPMLAAAKTLASHSNSDHPPQLLPITRQDEIGELIGGFNRLLTILGQRENALKESEARFRNMADHAPALIWMTDTLNIGTWYNKRWLEHTGRAMEQELRLSWIENIHPDDQQFCSTCCKIAFDSRQQFDMEFRLRRADGAYIWVADTGAPRFDNSGNFLGYISYCWDISELKRVETEILAVKSQLQDTLDAIPDLLFEIGLDGQYYAYHSPHTDLLAAPAPELIGKKVSDFLPPIAANVVMAALHVAQEKGRSSGKQFELALPQGNLWFELSVSRKHSVTDEEPHFIVMSRDITERKTIELQLRDLTAHIQTVREEEKTRIAREIHDELGGTMTALKIEAHQLNTNLVQNKSALPLLRQVESMSQLINNAAGITRRIISDLRPTVLDDLGLLAAIEWEVAQFHKRTGIAYLVNCIGDLGNLDMPHSIALYRILQEALTNVARHSAASRVEIEFHHSEDEVMLSVSDNGRGLPENSAAPAKSFGILGMSERVEQLGGTIRFDTPPEGGLRLTVIIPLHIKERSI